MTTAPPEPRHWHELPHAPAPGTVLGRMDALPDGVPQLLHWPAEATADAPPKEVFRYLLMRSGDTVKAYANRCAHFGVPLAARQEHLIFKPHLSVSCNVHYARYRWSDGVCEAGDCEGESLLPIPVHIDAQGCVRVAAA